MVYNTTNLTNANNFFEIMTEINVVSSGLFSALMLLSLFLITLMVFKNYPIKSVMVGNSFLCTIVSVFMFISGWIGWQILIIPIILLFGSIFAFNFME